MKEDARIALTLWAVVVIAAVAWGLGSRSAVNAVIGVGIPALATTAAWWSRR